jgi:phosphocarrier protein FPr
VHTTVVSSETLIIPNETGIHARPSAILASRAKQYPCDIQLHLTRTEKSANAKSVVAIMGLDIAQGDVVLLKASGEMAEIAVTELSDLLLAGCLCHE